MTWEIRETVEYKRNAEKIRDAAVLNQLEIAKDNLRNATDPRTLGDRKHNSNELVYSLPKGYRLGYHVINDNIIEFISLMDVNKHDQFYRDFNKRAS